MVILLTRWCGNVKKKLEGNRKRLLRSGEFIYPAAFVGRAAYMAGP
jgi:hypothetical protein